MKKILLINPPSGLYIRDDRCQSSVDSFMVSVARPPHELLLMAGALNPLGFTARIKDYPILNEDIDDFKNDFHEFTPDVLVINATIPSLIFDLVCAKTAKEINSKVLVVLRCGQVVFQAEEILKNNSDVDLILYGETDFTLFDFFSEDDKTNVKGLFFRNNGDVVKTDSREFLSNLDGLPLVDRTLINNKNYIRPDTGVPLALIEVSRGCPYGCIYCLTSAVYGKEHRRRSVKSIVNEVADCISVHGIKDFHFKSDLFSFDKKWVLALCEELESRHLNINWFANSRVDSVDFEMLLKMKQSGCFALAFGVESGSQFVLDKIEKNTTLQKAKDTFSLCRRVGIDTYAYFMIGFPWDNEKTINETIYFSSKIKATYVDFFFPYVFQGTKLYDIVFPKGQPHSLKRKAYVDANAAVCEVDIDRLYSLRRKALIAFYLRPTYIFSMVLRCKNIRQLYRLFLLGSKAFFRLF